MRNNSFEIRFFGVTEFGYVDVISIQSNRLRVDTFREDGRRPFYKLRESFREIDDVAESSPHFYALPQRKFSSIHFVVAFRGISTTDLIVLILLLLQRFRM